MDKIRKGGMEEIKKDELKRVQEVVVEMGVELKGEMEVKFRAGKKAEGNEPRPRPLIVRVGDDETRERIFKEARNLSKVPRMKKVFIAQC